MTSVLPNRLIAFAEQYRRAGFAICNDVLTANELQALEQAVAEIPESEAIRRKRSVYVIRNLLEVCPEARRLAASESIRRLVVPVLGTDCFAVRAIFFNKSPSGNWALGWHQDSVISVKQRKHVDGFVAWSEKVGVVQVQPPDKVMSRLMAVRVHLDASHQSNGPLRVIPQSHLHGWLDDEIDDWKAKDTEFTCTVAAGGVVAINPLTLHASTDSQSDDQRRVIHIEYACDDLPGGLEWNNRIYGASEVGSSGE